MDCPGSQNAATMVRQLDRKGVDSGRDVGLSDRVGGPIFRKNF